MRGSIGHVDYLIRFGGQKVKGQGRSGSNKGQYLTFLALKAATHDQVNLTSMLDQVTCSSELDRLYGET